MAYSGTRPAHTWSMEAKSAGAVDRRQTKPNGRHDEQSCEQATESAVRNEVVPEGLKRPPEKIEADVENGLT